MKKYRAIKTLLPRNVLGRRHPQFVVNDYSVNYLERASQDQQLSFVKM